MPCVFDRFWHAVKGLGFADMDSAREPLLSPGSGTVRARKNVAADTESLSFDPPTNKPRLQDHKEWKGARHLYGYTGYTAVARVSTVLAGVLTGKRAWAQREKERDDEGRGSVDTSLGLDVLRACSCLAPHDLISRLAGPALHLCFPCCLYRHRGSGHPDEH